MHSDGCNYLSMLDIADTIKDYLCIIGPYLASKLPREDTVFKNFVINKIWENIFVSPTSEQ